MHGGFNVGHSLLVLRLGLYVYIHMTYKYQQTDSQNLGGLFRFLAV